MLLVRAAEGFACYPPPALREGMGVGACLTTATAEPELDRGGEPGMVGAAGFEPTTPSPPD